MDIAAANFQSFLNPMINIFAYLSLKHFPFPFSAWSILTIQLLSIPAIVLIVRETGRELGYDEMSFTLVPALILSLMAPLWWSELGTTFSSSWTAPLILWGLYLLLRNVSRPLFMRINLAVSGFLFGFAAGLKLTNAPFAVSAYVVLLYLIYVQGWLETVKKSLLFVFGGITGFAVTAWWYWYLWDVWENPVFPLYNAIFKSPYYDVINFRDMRWHFSNMQEFLLFFFQTVSGTAKTSEVLFADARFLIIAILVFVAVLCKPARRYGRRTTAFMVFVLTGFILWSVMFAYQRYLIPIELLFGLVIWILVVRIFEQERVRFIILALLVALSGCMVKIPDWGHADVPAGSRNPFSVEMNDVISGTPGRYIVVRNSIPISYVLPSFHPESIFYGVDFSKKVDEMITEAIAGPSHLPLRILALSRDAHTFPERLRSAGYDPASYTLDCNFFNTGIGKYVVCEVNLQTEPHEKGIMQ